MAQEKHATQAASHGIALFGFSIILFTLPDRLLLSCAVLAISVILGIVSILPQLKRLLANEWASILINVLAYLAWYLGFIVGWLQGPLAVAEPWKMVLYYAGFFWLLIIILLLARSMYTLSENKRPPLNWILRWFLPASLLAVDIKLCFQGEFLAGLWLIVLIILTSIIAAGKWKPEDKLPALFD